MANPSDGLTAPDVYQLLTVVSAEVRGLTSAVTITAVLVVVLICVLVAMFAKILSALDKITSHQSRTEKFLDMAEAHGRVSDSQKERTVQAIEDTQRKIGELTSRSAKIGVRAATAAAERLATAVAEQIHKASSEGAPEAGKLPADPEPPAAPPAPA